MSATCESKRSNRKAKKKRSVEQTKEDHVPKAVVASEKMESSAKIGLDASIPLSQVVNKSSFTPFLDGERCILCHQERPSIPQKAEKSNAGVDILPGAQQFVDKLPLWVCPECRKRVEDDERKAGLDSDLLTNNDMMFQSSEGVINSFVSEEGPNKNLCNCHVCAGTRHLVPAKTKEIGELQFSWFEVKHFVRCVYRQAGTTLADDDNLTKTSLDADRMKRHTDKLTSRDPCQLFERLEAQTREYLREVRVSLIKFFSSSFSNSPQHAKDCVMTLLDEYQSFCVATDILKPFFKKLDSSYLKNFQWSWELMNKELFGREIFNDSDIQNKLPELFQQFRAALTISSCGVPGSDKCMSDSATSDLIERFEAFTRELTETNSLLAAARPLREKYDKEKNLHERSEHENWDEPLKNKKHVKMDDICGCEKGNTLSNHLTCTNDVSNSLLSLKRSLSSSSSSSSSRSPTQCCSRHAQNGCTDGDELSNMSSTQLLPTALFLNRLTNSKCATCIREALHSFCFDQNTPLTKCRHHEDHNEDLSSSLNELPSFDSPDTFHNCDNHTSHEPPYPFWYNHDTPPPETASSIQNLVLNGNSTGSRCQSVHCKNHVCRADWEDEVNDEREDEGCHGHEGCNGHEHRGPFSPSIMIPGNNLDVEAPPSSPSSDRSGGDGSSCDTPTSRSSLSEDGPSNNGKYCDCCYCELFGHGNTPVTPASHKFVEMREKLRLRLKTKEKKQPIDYSDHPKGLSCITDTRSVDELLTFINGDQAQKSARDVENKASSKAAKRQRQKQKKAAEKIRHIPETHGKDTCLLNKDQVKEMDGRSPVSEESSKTNTRQKKSIKARSQENLSETQRENAKNHEKSLKGDVKQAYKQVQEATGNMLNERPKTAPENGNHVDKRKKGKEKKTSGRNKSEGNEKGNERRVIVNGFVRESTMYVEHTRGAVLPVREEAEPKHCGEEAPPQDTQTKNENQGKKTKSRKKKKGACLDDVFLPKENVANGHNGEVDEAEREVEEFKRFCASQPPVPRKLKLPANVNLKNLNFGLKKS